MTLANGNLKNIEDVKIGEEVKGKDGTINRVLAYDRPIVGNRSTYIINNKIEFTGDHPFLTKEGKWKVADLELFRKFSREVIVEETPLSIGDVLVTENGEEVIINIKELKTRPFEETVYDLKLDGDHTYVANGFIVHNC